MSKFHHYLKIEFHPDFTEEEIDDIKSSLEFCLSDWHYFGPKKPVIVKKITYTTSQNNE